MTADTTCPACGSPVDIMPAGEVTVCPSCGTELTVDPESQRLLPVRMMAENNPIDDPMADEPPVESFFTEPAGEPEPVEPPRGAEVFESPQAFEPVSPAPPPPPPGQRRNPWLIGGLIAVLVICLACLCLIAVLAIFFPATWEQFSGLLPAALAFTA